MIDVGTIASLLEPVVREALEAISNKLNPAIAETSDGFRLENIDRRLSLGLSKDENRYVCALLVEKEDSSAQENAQKLQELYPTGIVVKVTGKAYSSKPQNAVKQPKPQNIIPGASIGHFQGFPGSVGGFVAVPSWAHDPRGILSASHVLAMNNTAKRGDPILIPGSPDGPRVLKHKIGTLSNYTYLVHYQEEGNDPINSEDVALVKPDDTDKLPSANLVPNPKDPNTKIKLKEVIPADELFQHVGKEVYKQGRTSGFTTGILEIASVLSYPIQLPDGRLYAYRKLAAVKNVKKKFSEPGDSGSIAYMEDGKAVGLVVGGSPDYTFLSPLSSCLEAMDAKLLV